MAVRRTFYVTARKANQLYFHCPKMKQTTVNHIKVILWYFRILALFCFFNSRWIAICVNMTQYVKKQDRMHMTNAVMQANVMVGLPTHGDYNKI